MQPEINVLNCRQLIFAAKSKPMFRSLLTFLIIANSCLVLTAQVKISSGSGTPDGSAMLEVESTSSGFLPPRMSTTERDQIANPADGLVLFNSTTNCLNFRVAGFWKEICGECTPSPTAANAGLDQLQVSSPSTNLAANVPLVGTGTWSILSGSGGSFDNINDPITPFTGNPGSSYLLRWSISSICGTTTDDVTISFAPNWKNVFVTENNVNTTSFGSGNLGGLAGADNICQTRATTAGLSGTYKAWLSDNGLSAATRLSHFNGEYRLINGTKIADNWADLTDGTLHNPINVTEFGNTLPGTVVVYTGTNTDGTLESSMNCSNWTSSSGNVRGGNGGVTNAEWTYWVFADCSGNWGSGWKLYCFEQ